MKPFTLEWVDKAEEDWEIAQLAQNRRNRVLTTLFVFMRSSARRNTSKGRCCIIRDHAIRDHAIRDHAVNGTAIGRGRLKPTASRG